MINKDFENWKIEVCKYLNSINEKLIKNIEAKKLYYGFDVIDGQLKENPEILFIGINPGKGNGEKHYKVKIESERISYLDYFDNEYRYHLAEETIKVFRIMGFSDEEIRYKLENQCVKTNLYHIITDNEKDINKAINLIDDYSFGEYYKKSLEYCMNLIKVLKPKIILFEGKNSYDQIVSVCYNKENTWKKDIKIGEFNSNDENLNFIGYSRTFSNINNKENLAEILKKYL